MGEQFKKVDGNVSYAQPAFQTYDEKLTKAWKMCEVARPASAEPEMDVYRMASDHELPKMVKYNNAGGSSLLSSGPAKAQKNEKGWGDYLWMGAEALLFVVSLPLSLMGCETINVRCPEDCKDGPCYDAGSEIVCGCEPGTHEATCSSDFGISETCCVADETDDCHNGWC